MRSTLSLDCVTFFLSAKVADATGSPGSNLEMEDCKKKKKHLSPFTTADESVFYDWSEALILPAVCRIMGHDTLLHLRLSSSG